LEEPFGLLLLVWVYPELVGSLHSGYAGIDLR